MQGEAERALRRVERERHKRLEKARVGRLLAQATLNDPLSEADFKNWAD